MPWKHPEEKEKCQISAFKSLTKASMSLPFLSVSSSDRELHAATNMLLKNRTGEAIQTPSRHSSLRSEWKVWNEAIVPDLKTAFYLTITFLKLSET